MDFRNDDHSEHLEISNAERDDAREKQEFTAPGAAISEKSDRTGKDSPKDDETPQRESEEQPKDDSQREERQSSSPISPMIYVMVGLFAVLAMMWAFGGDTGHELKYSDFNRLVELGAPSEENPDPGIIVQEGTEKEPVKVRYSKLHDITVGTYEIRGKVTREVLEPEKEDAKTTEQADDADDKKIKGDVDEAQKPAETKDGAEKDGDDSGPEADADTEAENVVSFYTFRLGRQTDDESLYARLSEAGFDDVSGPTPPGALEAYGPTLIMLLLFVTIFFFLFRRMGGAGAMAFGRSRGRFVHQEEIEVTFDDVAGVDEAVEELREVVEFLKTPEKYHVLGGRIPCGVLLVGPPGTGKTLLAKAVAGEAGVPFFSLSGSDFVEMYVGVGAARVRDMFQQSQQQSPCIIFIDELDALGKARGSGMHGGHDEREQTLNALLVEMDGFNSDHGTIVMAATNRPETLDPALLRPGRFDRQVLVDRPDLLGREAILKVHMKDVKVDESVDVKHIAAMTSGFAGADLAALVNEAALLAARAGKDCVRTEEFSEAVERVTAGLEKRKRVMHEEEKRRVAYHESGHALVAHCLPHADPVHKVSIVPRGIAALGYTMQRPEDERFLLTKPELESRIQVLLAGTIAEELVFDDISTGAQNDLERATEIARSMVMDYGMSRLGRVTFRESKQAAFLGDGMLPPPRLHSEQTAREIDEEIRHIVETMLGRVRDMLKSQRDDLERLSVHLLEKEVLNSEELEALFDGDAPDTDADVPLTEETA